MRAPHLHLHLRNAMVLLCLLTAAGCGQLHLDPAAGERSVYVPVRNWPETLAIEYHPTPSDSAFEIRARAHWVFWMLPLNHPNWETLMRETFDDADGIGNLAITTRTGTLDALAGVLTLGFYRTCQVIATGDRVRLRRSSPEQEL